VWAVVGLGNPGPRYAATRHNAGFLFVKRVARAWEVKLRKHKYLSKTAEAERGGERVLLALPQTYMNESGRAVRAILDGSGLEAGRCLVVFDDVDLPLGQIRIRREGGPGTHQGMASVVAEIGTTAFPRIRVGIGPVPEGADIVAYVLSPFGEEEKPVLAESLARAASALDEIVGGRIDRAMNAYN
jgi:PTH1 family peptidyl-tRNA hydrolase